MSNPELGIQLIISRSQHGFLSTDTIDLSITKKFLAIACAADSIMYMSLIESAAQVRRLKVLTHFMMNLVVIVTHKLTFTEC
jgi:hypothetical protein